MSVRRRLKGRGKHFDGLGGVIQGTKAQSTTEDLENPVARGLKPLDQIVASLKGSEECQHGLQKVPDVINPRAQ